MQNIPKIDFEVSPTLYVLQKVTYWDTAANSIHTYGRYCTYDDAYLIITTKRYKLYGHGKVI